MSRYPTLGEGPAYPYPYDRNLLAYAPTVTRADRQVCMRLIFIGIGTLNEIVHRLVMTLT
jgi:hypothetical protein